MPKFKTERITLDGAVKNELDFKIDVNITEAGHFTATLPEHIATMFKDHGIKVKTNGRRNAREGYYEAQTYFSLVEAIKHDCKEYVSREMIRETIVIRYIIQTTMSYLINKQGDIVPNGGYDWMKGDYGKTDDLSWRQGTISQNATDPHPYGIRIYCDPCWKREYRYRSGKEVIEYDNFREDDADKNQPNLKWLAGLCSMKPPGGEAKKEIEYTEANAYFFVNFIKGLCKLNEMIKDFLEPDMLQLLINKNFTLLPEPKKK
jgi:hypothetical protein